MPYQGTLVSIDEMFDELVRNGRERRDAAIELQRALEEGAIVVIFNHEPLGAEHLAGIGEMLRAFVADPQEAKRHFGWAVDILKYGRASRAKFERACELVEQPAAQIGSDVQMSRENAVRTCIESGMIPASTATWDAF